MSFTKEIKAEIGGVAVRTRHCGLALVSALSIYGSESAAAKEIVAALCADEFAAPLAYSPVVIKSECCKKAFLRGAFIAAGYCAGALSAGHLEFAVKPDTAGPIIDALGFFELTPRKVTRKREEIVYIKDGGEIADVLALMGATRCRLAYENGRVEKDVNNHINRAANCEAANADKLAFASVKQVEDIRKIEAAMGLAALPEKLREVAQLRVNNPEWSLAEIAEKLSERVTKSGVSHRLKRISQTANEIEG